MPIPGSVLNTLFIPSAGALSMYPSRATFYPVSKTKDSTSQEVHTFVASTDPTLVNRPCRRSPLIQVRPQNQENQEGSGIQRKIINFQVNFPTYVNVPIDQLVEWRISVDGVQYEVRSVEPDGNNLTTRLMVSIIEPFNP